MSLTDDGSQLRYQSYFRSSHNGKKIVYWRKGEVNPAASDEGDALEKKGYVYVGGLESLYKGQIDANVISEIKNDLKGWPANNSNDACVKTFPETTYAHIWNDPAGLVSVSPFGSKTVFKFDSWDRAREYLALNLEGDNVRYEEPKSDGKLVSSWGDVYSFEGNILSDLAAPGIYKCEEILNERILVLPAAEIRGELKPSADKAKAGNGEPAGEPIGPIAPKAILILSASDKDASDGDLWRAFSGVGNEWDPRTLEVHAFKRLRSVASRTKIVEFGKFTCSEDGSFELKPSWMWQFSNSDKAFLWKPTNQFQLKFIKGASPAKVAGQPIGPEEIFFGGQDSFKHVSTEATDQVDLYLHKGKGKYLPRRVTLSGQSTKYPLTFVRISETSVSYLLNQELTVGQVSDLIELVKDGDSEVWLSPWGPSFAEALITKESRSDAKAVLDQGKAVNSRILDTVNPENRKSIETLSDTTEQNPFVTELRESWGFASTLGNALVGFDSTKIEERRAEFRYWAWMYLQLKTDLELPKTVDSGIPETPDAWRQQAATNWQIFQWKHRLVCLENYIAQRALMWCHHKVNPASYDVNIHEPDVRFRTKVNEYFGKALGSRFESVVTRYLSRQAELSPRTLAQVAGPHPFDEPVVLWTPKMVDEFLAAFVRSDSVTASKEPDSGSDAERFEVTVPTYTEWASARKLVSDIGWSVDKLGIATVSSLGTVSGWHDITDPSKELAINNLAGNVHEFVQEVKARENDGSTADSISFYLVGDSYRTTGWNDAAVICNYHMFGTDVGVRLALRQTGGSGGNEIDPRKRVRLVSAEVSELRSLLLQTLFGNKELPGATHNTHRKTAWENQSAEYRKLAGEDDYWLDELIRVVMYSDSNKHFNKAQTPSANLLETVYTELLGPEGGRNP